MSVRPKMFPEPDQDEEKLSLVSKFTRILIAMNLLPVALNRDKTKARFSLLSLKTMTYLFISYSPFFVFWATFLFPSDYLTEYLKKYPEIYTKFDMVWLLVFTIGSNVIGPLWMVVVAAAFCHLPEVRDYDDDDDDDDDARTNS